MVSSSEKRSLRSNDGSTQKLNKIIFDFDTSVSINYKEKLLIKTMTDLISATVVEGLSQSLPLKKDETGPDSTLVHMPQVSSQNIKDHSSSSGAQANHEALITVGTNSFELFTYRDYQKGRRRAADPLTYKPFEAYHTFLERAERRTQTSERERHASEVERLTTLLDDLEGPDWRRKLLEVTAIVNPSDRAELDLKRERTLEELRVYIAKYHATRSAERRLKRLKQQRERSGRADHDEDPGVDDFGSALDSDEDEDAYVYEYVYDLKSFQGPDNNISNNISGIGNHAFGVELPVMKRVDFKLPDEWKRKKRR